jgi:RND family efflux transporter MFP subunit
MITQMEHIQMEKRVACTLTLLMMTAALLAGCAPKEALEIPPETARNVRVLSVASTDLLEYFEISGPLRPLRGTDVSAEEAGTVASLTRDKGDHVDAGGVLVELDRRLLAAQVSAAAAGLELAEYNAQQTQRLFEADKVSRVQALTAQTQARQARAGLQVAQLRYDRAAVKAPFSGLVSDRYVEPGQLVAPGQPVARVVDPYVLKLTGALTEREVGWLKKGASAQIRLDALQEPVTGSVGWLAFEADPVSGKFQVEINVDNAMLELRPGVMGRATIHKRTLPDVLLVPRDAVMESALGRTVYVVEGDRARRRQVELGEDQGLMVVASSGLHPGDRVVVRGHRDLVEGALVRVTETATGRDGGIATDPVDARESSASPRGVTEGTAP